MPNNRSQNNADIKSGDIFILTAISLRCVEVDVQIPFRSCDRVGEIFEGRKFDLINNIEL